MSPRVAASARDLPIAALALGCPLLGCLASGCSASVAPVDGVPPVAAHEDRAVVLPSVDGNLAVGDPRWPTCDPQAKRQELTFVHVNDLHAHYQLDARGVSPYSRIRGFYEKVRAAQPYAVFTSGGDEFEKGALAEILSEGASTLAVLSAMAFDVRVIGNHDYAWSEEEVFAMSRDARASVLESNVTYEGSNPAGFGAASFVTIQIGCLRVGFAGLVGQPWSDQDRPVSRNYYYDLSADYDFVRQATALVAAHRAEVDVLVFIDHLGLTEDRRLAARVPGIDVILSAHSHELTPTPIIVGGTVIIQAGAYAEHVARLDLNYDLVARQLTVAGYVVADVDATMAPASAVADTITDVLDHYAPRAREVVGFASGPGTAHSLALVAATAAKEKFEADAAVVDATMTWETWNAGSLSDQQLLDAFKVERQLPGSPAVSSFYTTTVAAAGIEAIRKRLGDRFVGLLPATTIPGRTYVLALQKRQAYAPEVWFPGLQIGELTFGGEAWEVVDFYARNRTNACLYLDVDQPLPTCP